MNLHAIVSGVIGVVNPNMRVLIQTSAGYKTNSDGKRVPAYNPAFSAWAQVQELSERDLQHLEGLNLQGSMRSMYLSDAPNHNGFVAGDINVNGVSIGAGNSALSGVIRVTQRGGDLITLPDNSVWLTTQVLEQFYDVSTPIWVKVATTLQTDAGIPPP